MYKKIFSLLLFMNCNIAIADDGCNSNDLVIRDGRSVDMDIVLQEILLKNVNTWFLADYFELKVDIFSFVFFLGSLMCLFNPELKNIDGLEDVKGFDFCIAAVYSVASVYLNVFTDLKYSYNYVLKDLVGAALFAIINAKYSSKVCVFYLALNSILVFLSKKKYAKKIQYIEVLKTINPDKYKDLKV